MGFASQRSSTWNGLSNGAHLLYIEHNRFAQMDKSVDNGCAFTFVVFSRFELVRLPLWCGLLAGENTAIVH